MRERGISKVNPIAMVAIVAVLAIVGVAGFMLLPFVPSSVEPVSQVPVEQPQAKVEKPGGPADVQPRPDEPPVLHVYPNRLGSESASITIFEYGDYQCPNCARFNRNVMSQLILKYVDTGIVKIYFRDFAYYGPNSITAAIAARCAGDQDMYWDYHHALYLAQGPINSGWANSTNLKTLFYERTLANNQHNELAQTLLFTECIDSEYYRNEVIQSYQDGLKEGVGATPTFIIIGPDGRKDVIVGPQPFPSFEKVIESILSG